MGVLWDAMCPSAVAVGIRMTFVSANPETAIHQRKRNSEDGKKASVFFIPEITFQSCLTRKYTEYLEKRN
jgi:hypothetical protein